MKILPTPEIIIGESVLGEVSSILERLNAQKVMVVTDKGIRDARIYKKLEDILSASNKKIILFGDVQPDPAITLASKVADLARKSAIDVVIGLGGGSSLDTAKVAAALVTNTGDINSYIGIDLLKEEPLPIIAIPTTAGTGSEVTPIAILSDEAEQLKKGIVSSKIIPRYAILDASLTIGLPSRITALTGMDALIHAMEAYTSIKAGDYSDCLALKAIEVITQNLRKAYNNGRDIKARENMLRGSLLAGIAFANAGVGAVHAFAYPLGAMFHIPHGLANSLLLSSVLEFNMVGNEGRFREIGRYFVGDDFSPQGLLREVNKLFRDLAIPGSLAELHIPEEAIGQLAEGAMKVTRLLANNPRPINLDDAVEIYRKAYYKRG